MSDVIHSAIQRECIGWKKLWVKDGKTVINEGFTNLPNESSRLHQSIVNTSASDSQHKPDVNIVTGSKWHTLKERQT